MDEEAQLNTADNAYEYLPGAQFFSLRQTGGTSALLYPDHCLALLWAGNIEAACTFGADCHPAYFTQPVL